MPLPARIVLFLLILWPVGTVATAGPILTIREASVTVTLAGQATSSPQQVHLPYRWDHFFEQREGGMARFRISLKGLEPASDEPKAIYLTKVGNQFEVRINGVLISSPLESQSTRLDFAKAPHLMTVPQALLHGDDVLEITIRTQALRRGGLSVIRFGEADSVQQEFHATHRWRIMGSLIVVCVSAVLGLFSLLLWSQQRLPLYLLFGVAELVWALRVSDVLIEDPPLGWPAWGVVIALAYALYVGLTGRLTLLVLNIEWPWVPLAWKSYLVGSVISTATFANGYLVFWTIWLALMIATALCCAVLAVYTAWRTHHLDHSLLAFSLMVAVIVGIRDWVYVWLNPDTFGDASWVRYVSLLFCLTMGFIIANRYTQATRELRLMNQTLADRIAERERQLAASFEQTREAWQQTAALSERQRLMRDMHDGLGSRLSGALSVLRGNPSSYAVAIEYLSEALEELKFTVDSLEDYVGDLGVVLGNLRYRLQDRLKAAGVRLIWQVQSLPVVEGLTPTSVRSIQHILLEALTNAIQHGAATEITLIATFDEGSERILIVLEDNGCGFDTRTTTLQGRGMRLIKQRAHELGGEAAIDTDFAVGCRVRIELPLILRELPEQRLPKNHRPTA